MSFSGDNVFVPIQFPARIDLKPNQIDKKMYQTLEWVMNKKYSGKCLPKIGYVKPGSLKIVSKQLGQYLGNHFTGNFTFRLQLAAMVTRPVKGQVIDAIVTSKYDTGLAAKNHVLPYTLYVPKMPGDENSSKIDQVAKNSYIRVEVIDSELNPPDTDTARSEYWVVCKLNDVDIKSVRRLDLPAASDPGDFMLVVKGYEDIDEDRNELTDEAYEGLQKSKQLIEDMNIAFAKAVRKAKQTTLLNDMIISNNLRPDCILGYINDADKSVTDSLQIQVILTRGEYDKWYKHGVNITVAVPEAFYYKDNLILLTGMKDDKVTASEATPIDMWSAHVRFIVNQYEMIHAPGAYRRQLDYFNEYMKNTVLEHPRANRHVINRAYYKMVELMDQVTFNRPMQIASIAESPGGFIQALIDRRTRDGQGGDLLANPIYDSINAMSLSTNRKGPWDLLIDKLNAYKGDQIVMATTEEEYTAITPDQLESATATLLNLFDEDRGDILDEGNRQLFYEQFNEKKADLVTADGGFYRDKSSSDTEEMDTAKLVIAEMLIALNIQEQGGNFMVKIFDMATYATAGCLSLLSYCYNNVYVYKPKTSRNASSEKYVICQGYKLDPSELPKISEQLKNILSHEVKAEDDGFMAKIMIKEDEQLLTSLRQYNGIYMKKQGDFIRNGREYASLYIQHMGDLEQLLPTIKSYITMQNTNAEAFNAEHQL